MPIVLICTLFGCDQQNETVQISEPLILSASEKKALQTTNDYAWRLLQTSYDNVVGDKTDVNHFVSPLSAAMVLGMVENGADGETRSEILRVLGFDAGSEEEMNAYYRRMMKELPVRSKYSTVHLANALWADDEFAILDTYRDAITTEYLAAVERGDFSSPTTAKAINDWCARHTDGRIPEMVSPTDLDGSALVLLNALYFKSDWQWQFDKEKTKDETFFAATQEYEVKLMHNEETYGFVETELLRMLEVDYKGRAYCMDFILPAGDNEITDVLKALDSRTFDAALDGLMRTDMEIAIPKFRLTYECTLTESLEAMGMKKAFDAADADFSRLADGGLCISLVKQKTTLEIDEEGTVATAVTLDGFDKGAAPTGCFMVNRPFILVIRERQSNIILFAGVINRP